MRRRELILGLLGIGAGAGAAYRFTGRSSSETPLGRIAAGRDIWLAPEDPLQMETARPPFIFRGADLIPVAKFEINALVLSRRNYSRDRDAKFSPTDLALGWGPMSNPLTLEGIDVDQRARWYFFKSRSFPVDDIYLNSSNMHMIPATEDVAAKLSDVLVGDLVSIRGLLVDIDGPDGYKWRTSTTRDDRGDGACEIIYVEDLTIRYS